jgi:hypothetical protein
VVVPRQLLEQVRGWARWVAARKRRRPACGLVVVVVSVVAADLQRWVWMVGGTLMAETAGSSAAMDRSTGCGSVDPCLAASRRGPGCAVTVVLAGVG